MLENLSIIPSILRFNVFIKIINDFISIFYGLFKYSWTIEHFSKSDILKKL
jgi:hypothetical protein